METVQIRRQGDLPTTINIRPGERLNRLAEEMAQHDCAIGDIEKEIRSLTIEGQRLDQSGTYSLETSQRSAEIKRELATLERQLTEHQTRRKRVADERAEWLEQFAMKEHLRRLLWQELASARPGPVSDWSISRMYNIGEKEQRTTCDVRRDLVAVICWLLRFGGPDDELTAQLQQLEQQPVEGV